MALKAMNCPGHFLRLRAAKSAAIATCRSGYHEQTPLHRNEASGVLSGPDPRPSVLAGRWRTAS